MLYEVKIDRDRNLTFVKIQQIPTKNLKRLNTVTPSFNTKIKSGNYEAEYLGVLQNDGTYRRSSCSDNWGWDNAKTGQSYFVTYIFNGAIPPGLTDFSLIDESSYSGCSGYKLGCIKDGTSYKLVYLSYGGTYMSWWKVGDVKAILRPSATTGVFKADWYMANKTANSDIYVTFVSIR